MHIIINPRQAQAALDDIEKGTNNGGANTMDTIKACLRKFTAASKVSDSCPDCNLIVSADDNYCRRCGKRINIYPQHFNPQV